MRKYIYISIGGALGAVLRVAIKNLSVLNFNGTIPYSTLVINFTGCFILALFLTVAFEVMDIDADLRLGISTGLLGGYTTFSTFCRETAQLISNGGYSAGAAYIVLSVGLGLAGAFFGVVLARKAIAKLDADESEVE